jgi:two-component system OmpR family response regulator
VRSSVAVVIDDDPGARAILFAVFEAAGFTAVGAENGLDGVLMVRERHPLITTVSAMLPGIDGFETVRRVRAISDTYIVLVSPHDDEVDAVLGLSSGADDYITTPLRPREFRARVEAMLRRPRAVVARAAVGDETGEAASVVGSTLQHRDLTVDTLTRSVRRAGTEISLTKTEYDVLCTLLESQRRPRKKDDLVRVARGDDPGGSDVSDLDRRAIEAHVTNLRRKLGDRAATPTYIETVRGIGYRLTASAAAFSD